MKRKNLALILGAALVVLTLAVLVTVLWPDRPRVTREEAQKIASIPGGEEEKIDPELFNDLLSYRFLPGKAYAYQFSRRVQASLKGQSLLDLELGGTLEAHTVGVSGPSIDVIIRVVYADVKGADMSGASDRTNAAYIRIDRSGRLESIAFPREMAEPEQQQVMKDVIANWLAVLPNTRSPEIEPEKSGVMQNIISSVKSYLVTSVDTQGEYTARSYLLEQSRSPALFKAQKIKYIRSPSPIKIDESASTLAFSLTKGYPLFSSAKERLSIGPEGFSVASEQSSSFEFKGVQDSNFRKSDLAFYTVNGSMYDERQYASKNGPGLQRPARAFDDLKSDLAGMNENTPQEKKHELFLDLTTAIKKDASLASRYTSEARKYGSKTDQFQMIMGALSYSGSPEAQTNLIGLFQSGSQDAFGQQSIVEAFILMDKALSPPSRQFLRDLFNASGNDDLKSSAGLALGSSLRNSPDDEIRAMLDRQWKSASTVEQKMSVLDFIGNSGDPTFFGIVQDAMSSGGLLIQRKAIYAARFMESDTAVNFLFDHLKNNPDDRSREKAAEAVSLHAWNDQYYDLLAKCVDADRFTPVRVKCAEYVLSQPSRSGDMRNVLSRTSQNDQDMREFVERSLRR